MGVAEYTLLADAVGANVSTSAAGTEISNLASRRIIETSEISFCRIQFGTNNPGAEIETQYSLDDGASWNTLIPRFKQAGIVDQGNQNSGWHPLPDNSLGRDIMTRVMLYGDGSPTRITYLSLQLR